MKEASWDDCVRSSSARKGTADIERAKSLVETSRERIAVINDIDRKNCNFVFEDYYTSMLEMLQAAVLRKGYLVTNHICLGYYLRDVIVRDDLYRLFDDLRYKRNSLTYYGNRMDFQTAKQAINQCRRLMLELEKLLKG